MLTNPEKSILFGAFLFCEYLYDFDLIYSILETYGLETEKKMNGKFVYKNKESMKRMHKFYDETIFH